MILAPGREALGYDELPGLVGAVAVRLRERGIGADDRVALVTRNGPEAALAFLSLATAAVCAPLNPTYRRNEYDFYLGDLRARAVVVDAGVEEPVREAARARGIDVIALELLADAPAGWFALGEPLDGAAELPDRDPEDVALLLHTSGTTARPKLVPLSHRNLTLSARNVAATLGLRPEDRCVNVMPLFHIHGLVAAVLASLTAGASVVCTPGFHPRRIFDWLGEHDPTWYTAVPTMHQSILSRWNEHEKVAGASRLRFARSSSAALPAPLLAQLEQTLGVPVVEAYGMTEAAHQMASNPLPPGKRVPGSVGLPAGPEIVVLGANGDPLPPGEVGEVAIRGSNVFSGYEANPEANAAAFVDGWFRTGDEGVLDGDGYLVLHGRLKELINRGGEKVAPIEVDERLLAHPQVAQAVTFAIPDSRLGEEVAAAVVRASGADVGEAELQDFVAQTLAPFKVPRRVVFVDDIPKGSTGKIQRIGLADRLGVEVKDGITDDTQHVSPKTHLETELAAIWADVLGVERVGMHDDFFALGGDSILGTEAIARIRDLTGRDDLPLVTIVRAPSVAAMARELEGGVATLSASGAVPIREAGSTAPLFFVHGGDGEILRFVPLARRLGHDRPFYGLRARGIDGGALPEPQVDELAADYVSEVRAAQPRGPYVLGGLCTGATIALEMAHELEVAGEEVALLVLIDPRFPRPTDRRFRLWEAARKFRAERFGPRVVGRLRRMLAAAPAPVEPAEAWQAFERAREEHPLRPSDAPAAVIFSADFLRFGVPEWSALRMVRGVRSVTRVDATHATLFRQPAVEELAVQIEAALALADGGS